MLKRLNGAELECRIYLARTGRPAAQRAIEAEGVESDNEGFWFFLVYQSEML